VANAARGCRLPFAARTQQRTERALAESPKSELESLTRRRRASAWLHERPGQTENSRLRLLKPQRHAIGLADRLHLGVFALRADQIWQKAVYVYAF
jgi:hypothetical protein